MGSKSSGRIRAAQAAIVLAQTGQAVIGLERVNAPVVTVRVQASVLPAGTGPVPVNGLAVAIVRAPASVRPAAARKPVNVRPARAAVAATASPVLTGAAEPRGHKRLAATPVWVAADVVAAASAAADEAAVEVSAVAAAAVVVVAGPTLRSSTT